MGLQAFRIMLAQIPKLRGGYRPRYFSQLTRELPREGEKSLLLTTAKSLSCKITPNHSSLHMPQRKLWSSLRPISVSPSLIWCKSSASFICIHCSFIPRPRGLALGLTPRFQHHVQLPMPQHTLQHAIPAEG